MFNRLLSIGRPNVIIFGILILFCGLVYIATASNQSQELKEQIELLNLRIEQTKQEYSLVADQKIEAQEACNLVSQRESQLKKMNELNNSRRKEIEILESKLSSFTSLPK